jgi:hypothetical protein
MKQYEQNLIFAKKENRKRRKAVDLKIQKSGSKKNKLMYVVYIAQARNSL